MGAEGRSVASSLPALRFSSFLSRVPLLALLVFGGPDSLHEFGYRELRDEGVSLLLAFAASEPRKQDASGLPPLPHRLLSLRSPMARAWLGRCSNVVS